MVTIKYSKATQWLFYSICAYFIMNGAQLWETALIVPAWTAALPSSLIFFQKPYGLDFKVFWIVAHAIPELIFITALVFNWKIKKLRNLILLVLVGHIAVRVWTLMYFAPTIIEFQRLPYSDTIDILLQEKAARWRNFNYARVTMFFALNFLLIPGLKIKEKTMNKKAIIIGAGVAGPILALQLKKIGFEPKIFESRSENNTKEGAFLGLTPNGLNVLKEFIDLRMLKEDYTPGSMKFFNSKGKQIAELDTAYQKQQYGVETLQLKRANINKHARITATAAGIKIEYDKKFVGYDEKNEQITAYFADGTTGTGDIMIGCDGMFSEVRNQLFPEASVIKYTKLISTGGYAKIPELSKPLDSIRMTFAERGFFAYSVSDKGEVWWFNNYFRAQQPKPQEIEKTLSTEIQDHLADVHKNDDPLFRKIIKNSYEIIAYPIYDVPKLSHWYKGRVCLIGDAAHGVSPHIGQGASLALEDTVVIAELLKSHKDYTTAFQIFQSERQSRVKKVIKNARKVGNTKTKTNPIAAWFRDRLLGFFIGKQIQQLDWIYGWTYSHKKSLMSTSDNLKYP